MKRYYVEFVGSLQVRWSIEIESSSEQLAKEDAIRSLPESSNDWALGDVTNSVIDVELVSCTTEDLEPHDRDLGRLELEDKYDDGMGGGEHPLHTRSQWKHCVAEDDTASGYWDWVYHMVQSEDEPDET